MKPVILMRIIIFFWSIIGINVNSRRTLRLILAVALDPTPLLAEHWYTPSWCLVTCIIPTLPPTPDSSQLPHLAELHDLAAPHHLHLVELAPGHLGLGVAARPTLDAHGAPLLHNYIPVRRLTVNLKQITKIKVGFPFYVLVNSQLAEWGCRAYGRLR